MTKHIETNKNKVFAIENYIQLIKKAITERYECDRERLDHIRQKLTFVFNKTIKKTISYENKRSEFLQEDELRKLEKRQFQFYT